MNILFTLIFLFACAILLAVEPNAFLPTLLDGASASASLCLSLLATYAVWLGLMRVWEDSGITRAVCKFLKPVAKRLFHTNDEQTLQTVCMNLSVNLLGISGAATPYGIRAVALLDQTQDAEYSSALFFVLNATSLQLVPTSIIAVRTSLGSVAPTDILLPTVLASLFSTLLGVFLTKLLIKRAPTRHKFGIAQQKIQGAGIG
ncbi:MAG: hypothetical protein J6A38_04630 [Clostridia bacterium]|nr:hypothetical protein [Clostridia bacterium]